MDFITQLPRTASGNDAIFVVVDKLTKMVHILPTVSIVTAAQTAKLYLDHVWVLHGVPAKGISDRGVQYVNVFTAALCSLIGTKLLLLLIILNQWPDLECQSSARGHTTALCVASAA